MVFTPIFMVFTPIFMVIKSLKRLNLGVFFRIKDKRLDMYKRLRLNFQVFMILDYKETT